MNKCAFFGQIVSLTFSSDEELKFVELEVLVENRRATKKHKNKQIDKEVLKFEAWGTAAITIASSSEVGDEILIIDSTARANPLRFRINEFKIIKKDQNGSQY